MSHDDDRDTPTIGAGGNGEKERDTPEIGGDDRSTPEIGEGGHADDGGDHAAHDPDAHGDDIHGHEVRELGRVTSPMQSFSTRQVGIGFLVLLVGLSIAYVIPLLAA